MKLFQKVLLFCLSCFSASTALKYKPVCDKLDNISDDISDVFVTEVSNMVDNFSSDNREFKEYETQYDEYEFTENMEFIDEHYYSVELECSNLIQHFFNQLDDESKVLVTELSNVDDEIKYFVNLGNGEGNSIGDEEKIFFHNLDAFENQNRNIKKSAAALGISTALYKSILSAATTASASSLIPGPGWALAATAIAALVIIIAVFWDTISRVLDKIQAFLIQKFNRISSLIKSAISDGKKEAKRRFPYNPEEFKPRGLYRFTHYGSYNGSIWHWSSLSYREDPWIFEWDEDYRNGRHYHIESHYGSHYYPGDKIPEPHASRYF